MKIIKEFFKPNLILLSSIEKLFIMIGVTLITLVMFMMGYVGFFEMNGDIILKLIFISFMVISLVSFLLVFTTLSGYGLMRNECKEEKERIYKSGYEQGRLDETADHTYGYGKYERGKLSPMKHIGTFTAEAEFKGELPRRDRIENDELYK